MADKQTQALKRLTKKLSALRKTLRKDERDLLDLLVIGEAAAEVEAHKAAKAVRGMVAIDAATSNFVVVFEGPEVEGHMLAAAVTPKTTPVVTPKAAM